MSKHKSNLALNMKAKLSDENLTEIHESDGEKFTDFANESRPQNKQNDVLMIGDKRSSDAIVEADADNNTTKPPLKRKSLRKISAANLPLQQEKSDKEDEFLFLRLGKEIRVHWDKIVDKYPSRFFKRTILTKETEHSPSISLPSVGIISNPSNVGSNLIKSSTFSEDSLLTLTSDHQTDFPIFIGGLIKSIFLLPAYILKREDGNQGGHRTVPLISSILDIEVETEPVVQVNDGSNDGQLFWANPMFSISCKYCGMRWKVHRKLVDIFRLHVILLFRDLQGSFPGSLQIPHFPNQFSYLLDASLLVTLKRDARTEQQPIILEDRREAIESYLKKLLKALNLLNVPELCEFFEFSGLSPKCLGLRSEDKGKEGYLRNRIFDTQTKKSIFRWLFDCLLPKRRHYRTKWFILRSSYLVYLDHIDQVHPTDVLLVDRHFKIQIENEGSNNPLKPFRLTIRNGSKELEVRPENNSQMPFWISQLNSLSNNCPFAKSHRFNSFAPVREACSLKWLIDAEEYYSALVQAIKAAKNEIYIHGWWLSPEVHLLRPASLNPQFRLDRFLQSRAQDGIKIYIVVYKELSLALPIDSYHTKSALESLHPNIRVQRHPDHLPGGVLYWAHHEKLVIIDQSIAFIGGLDIAFGRYDDHSHKLNDNHPDNPAAEIWTGIDYSNARIRDFRNVIQYANPLINRSNVPRMPWHDVHCTLKGQAARDLARHFIESWNNVKKEKAMQKVDEIPFLLPMPDIERHKQAEEDGGTCRVQVVRSASEWSLGCPTESSIYEAYLDLIERSEHFIYIENQFLITNSRCESGERYTASPVKNRIGSALVERILRAHREGRAFRVIVVMPLLPAFEAAVDSPDASSVRMLMQAQYASISKGPSSILGRLKDQGIMSPEHYISFYSLRTHDTLDSGPVTEQVYVHSKLAIFDDKYALIGSANINDRSLLGFRDSETALVIEDSAKVLIHLSGGSVLHAGQKVHELRIRLWREHLGLLGENLSLAERKIVESLQDPLNDSMFYEVWRDRASRNTQIYRELFHCLPDDYVGSWSEYALFVDKPKVATVDPDAWEGIDVMANLSLVSGNLVLFPVNFLKKEELVAHVLSAEYLLPTEIYM